ncbi:MAG: hypothetical protein ACRCVU_11450 [Flavobacterium sp.]
MELKKITWVFIAFFLMMAGCKTKAYTASEYLSTTNYVDIYRISPTRCNTHIVIYDDYRSTAFLIKGEDYLARSKTVKLGNKDVLKENIEKIAKYGDMTKEPLSKPLDADMIIMYINGQRKINSYRNIPKEYGVIDKILFKKYGMKHLFHCD